MKKLPELHARKGLFKTAFISSIVLFALGLVFSILNLVLTAMYISIAGDWALYATLIIDIVLFVAFFFASATVLVWDPDNRGGTILAAGRWYLLVTGVASLVSGMMLAFCYEEVKYAISAIIGVIQIGLCVMAFVVQRRKPSASLNILGIAFLASGVIRGADAIIYALEGKWLFTIYPFIAVIFVFIVDLILGKLANDNFRRPQMIGQEKELQTYVDETDSDKGENGLTAAEVPFKNEGECSTADTEEVKTECKPTEQAVEETAFDNEEMSNPVDAIENKTEEKLVEPDSMSEEDAQNEDAAADIPNEEVPTTSKKEPELTEEPKEEKEANLDENSGFSTTYNPQEWGPQCDSFYSLDDEFLKKKIYPKNDFDIR